MHKAPAEVVNHPAPLIEADVLQRDRRNIAAGIVDEKVEPAELGFDLTKEVCHLLGKADIAGHRPDRPAGFGTKLGGGFFQNIAPAAGNDDNITFSAQGAGDAAADAGASAGDERDLAFLQGCGLRHLRFYPRVRRLYGS